MKRSNLYTRKRILALLQDIEHYPVTVLVASTGYGKTTSVKQFLAQTKDCHLYLDITSFLDELLWHKLCDGLNSFAPDAAQSLRLNGVPTDELKIAAVIDVFRNLVPVPFILVLDDCQLLSEDSPIFKLIITLVLEELPQIHLVLISQKMPSIKVSTLVFKDRCLLLERETLAFTLEETRGYLEWRGMHLASEAILSIYQQSGGWISVLFFISEAFRHGRVGYRLSSLNQMFEENFLLYFSPSERDMLIRLSALDEFSAELAVVATGNQQSRSILLKLERNNAFITCDGQGWYRFHGLLKAYLSAQCPQDEEQNNFYLRAGYWYLMRKQYYQALWLYKLSGKLEQFLQEVETFDHWSRDCRTLLAEMAPDLKNIDYTRYPSSFLEVAFALLRIGKDSTSKLGYRILQDVEAWAKTGTTDVAHRIYGDCILIQTFLGLYEDDDWNQHFQQAQAVLGKEKSRVLMPADPITFGMPMFLYLEYRKPGILNHVIDQDTHCPLERMVPGFGRGMDKVIKAEAALVRCRTAEAENYAQQALVITRSSHQYFLEMCALFTLLRRNLFTGDYIAALEQMESMRTTASLAMEYWDHYSEDLYRQVLEYSEIFLNTVLGHTEKIPKSYLSGDKFHNYVLGGMGLCHLLRARVAYILGDVTIAAAVCDLVLDLKTQHVQHSQLIRLGALILKSQAEDKLLNKGLALKLLGTAVQEAALDQIYLPFVEDAAGILPLLAKLRNDVRMPKEYIRQLEELCRQHKGRPINWKQPTIRTNLSNRELKALRLAARGMNQNQIAIEMQVKVVTVKKHLINAYAKLGAPNKVAAIQLAKAQNLL